MTDTQPRRVAQPEQDYSEEHRQGRKTNATIAAQDIGCSRLCICRGMAAASDGVPGGGVVSDEPSIP